MSWMERILLSCEQRGPAIRPELSRPASPAALDGLERTLGVRLPASLRSLLEETDGFVESMQVGGDWTIVGRPLWSCDEIAIRNARVRARGGGAHEARGRGGAPVLFADAGVDGILFAMFVVPAGADDPRVYAWFPLDEEWRVVSPSLEEHLRGWTV